MKWCGLFITPDRVGHDLFELQGFMEMECSETGGRIQQFSCAMQWLRSEIQNFQPLTHELQAFLELAYTLAGRRTKRAVSCLLLDKLGCSGKHTVAFAACKSAITIRTKLPHRDESERLAIYTEACDLHCSGIANQVLREQLTLQQHA